MCGSRKKELGRGHSRNLQNKFGIEPLLGDKMFEHECAVVQYFIGNVNIPFFSSKTSDLIYF